jgi:alcohol dehydrogenase (NADP+)
MMMASIAAYAALSAGQPLEPFSIERREPGPEDVVLDILFCGVCHTDVHQARGEWRSSRFPMVPGHEIVGRVERAGERVKKLAPGDLAGVGCLVDSCRRCDPCRDDLEQFCQAGPAVTYNGTEMDRKTPTQGGYSTRIVVPERFALKIPAGLDPAAAAPLLCAGITTYSPLREWNIGAGARVGVVGLGGLGHMAVKLAASMGAEVTALSRSRDKQADASRLGAASFALTGDDRTFDELAGRFDLVIDTLSAPHDVNRLLRLVRVRGALVLVGLPPEPLQVEPFSLLSGDLRLAGSSIGGLARTQEMLDYCAERGIASDVEVIPIQRINEAFERMLRSDVRYRFVIDLASLK